MAVRVPARALHDNPVQSEAMCGVFCIIKDNGAREGTLPNLWRVRHIR